MKESEDIKLALNQNANAGECGSCLYFDRRGSSEYDNQGYCKFKLPPTRIYTKQVWDGDSQPLDTVYDTNTCSLYRHSGKTYIISKRIKPS